MVGRFELRRATDGRYFFDLKASNGQVILTSELYQEKDVASQGIEALKRNAAEDRRYERMISVRGDPYFVLRAADSDIIVFTSGIYSGPAAMEKVIAAVKQNAPSAAVKDRT